MSVFEWTADGENELQGRFKKFLRMIKLFFFHCQKFNLAQLFMREKQNGFSQRRWDALLISRNIANSTHHLARILGCFFKTNFYSRENCCAICLFPALLFCGLVYVTKRRHLLQKCVIWRDSGVFTACRQTEEMVSFNCVAANITS